MSNLAIDPARCGVIFDLDGVLTDTAELHFQSWVFLTDKLGIPFDRAFNEQLRGRSREESLDLVLASRRDEYTPTQKAELTRAKNDDYLARVEKMTEADAFPGVRDLLTALRADRVPCAVASSSRNAARVLSRIGLAGMFDALVDGNMVPRSKPDPEVFLEAARRIQRAPRGCVVLEDAEAGVAGARRAGMLVIGIGPPERVGAADRVVSRICEVSRTMIYEMLTEAFSG